MLTALPGMPFSIPIFFLGVGGGGEAAGKYLFTFQDSA